MNAESSATRWVRLSFASACIALTLGLGSCGGGDTTSDLSSDPKTAATSRQAISAVATTATATVIAVTKVSETRVSRTVFDYVFKVTVQNGDVPQTSIIATLTKVGAGTSIIDGSVLAGDLAANASVTPADTITLRHDRALTFDLAALTWQVTGTPVVDPLIEGAQLAGGLSGSALVGQPYTAQVNAFANDKRNSITGFAIANATVGGSTPAIDSAGVLSWTPNDADFASTKTLSGSVTLSQGAPVQFDVPVRVTKERLVHTAELPAAASTITDPRGRYLIKAEPKVANESMSGILTINEIYEASGRFVYAIRVPVSAGAQVTVLDAPNLFGSADTPQPFVAQSLGRKTASAVRAAAATASGFELKSDIGLYLDTSLSGLGQKGTDGVNVYTTRTKTIDGTAAYMSPASENSTPQIAKAETKAWLPLDHVFQIDANCTTFEECQLIVSKDSAESSNVRRSPVILIHGFNPLESVGGGKETWGALAETLTARGHPVFELRWNTYMRFEEAAGVLAKLGVRVASITGKKVHVIAHSFGGIVAHQALMGQGITYTGSTWDSVDPKNAFQRLITLGAPLSGISKEPSAALSLTAGRDDLDVGIDYCKAITCFQAGADTVSIAFVADDLASKVSRIDPGRYTVTGFKNGQSIRNLQKAWGDGTAHSVKFATVVDLKKRPFDDHFPDLKNQTAYRLGDGLISLIGQAVVASDFSSTPYAPKEQFNILASTLGSDFLSRLDTKFAGNMDRRVVASQVSTAHREYYFALRAAHSCAQLELTGQGLINAVATCASSLPQTLKYFLIANYPEDGIVRHILSEAATVHPLYGFIYGNGFSTYLAEPPVSFVAITPPIATARGMLTRGGIAITQLPAGSTIAIERKSTGVRVTDNLPISPGTTTGSFTFDVGAALSNALPNQTIALSDYRVNLKITSDSPYANFSARRDVSADIDFGTIDITPTLASGYVSVGGIVTNQGSQFVPGAQVTLLKGENRSREQMLAILPNSPSVIARSMTTNTQGQFNAQGMEVGVYTVLVTKPGYNDTYQGRVLIGSQGNLSLSFVLGLTSTALFSDDFNGAVLDPTVWNPRNWSGGPTLPFGVPTVGNGLVHLANCQGIDTANKATFSGSKFIIESRFAGQKPTGRDTSIALVDPITGREFMFHDTNYRGWGQSIQLATNGIGSFNGVYGGTTSAFKAYRITMQGTNVTVERGDTLTTLTERFSVVLPRTVTDGTYYLRLGTGGCDGVYSPADFDWIRVTTY